MLISSAGLQIEGNNSTIQQHQLKTFAYFGYFIANLCTFWYTLTGYNNAVVCHN